MKKKLSAATVSKYTKTPVALGCILRFPRAMLEIAKASRFGWEKHKVTLPEENWDYLDMPGAKTAYIEAEGRHMLAEAIEGPINKQDDYLLHKAQKAWNALADLEVYLYQQEKEEDHG